jgi:hypothetical protein
MSSIDVIEALGACGGKGDLVALLEIQPENQKEALEAMRIQRLIKNVQYGATTLVAELDELGWKDYENRPRFVP